ncbi:hypothetical protein BKA70DRAFT_1146351, partial [Coprinopsis sp. MPI-PUGE-AT-0042]
MLPATPFKDRLSTNYIPSDDETIAIQKLIEAVEPQIDSLDAEIETMKQRRAIYASFVADHRALISPIRHMPPDILHNIFSHCVPYDTPGKVMQASEAPLLLVQICRHWRDLAIKTPTLWSTIFLKIPVESLVSLTTAWLSRAEGCPLTIFFRDIDAIQSSPIEESFLSLSPSQVPRLRSIRMEWLPRQPIFDVATHTFHHTLTPATGTTAPTSPLLILKATRLQHLSLGGFTGNLKDIPVAWSNLTEFSHIRPQRFASGKATSFSPSAALALLQGCPNLVRCELNIFEYTPAVDVNPDQTTVSQHIKLPRLQRFVVSEYKNGPSLTFLDSLELPALDSLTLSVTLPLIRRNENPPPISLRPLLIASGHQIHHLELGNTVITVTELIDHLKLAVGVTELTINMCSIVPQGGIAPLRPAAPAPPFYRDELLSMLAPSDASSPTICPNLAILKLTIADPSDITTRAVKNLVAHR